MRKALLAIDIGGSTTRACLVDTEGRCLGLGRSRGGNPASNDPEFGAASIIAAVEAAHADAGGEPLNIIAAQLALAGPPGRVALEKLQAAFRRLGLSGPILVAGDLLAMFASITPATNGYCVVAGTGAGAVRIRDGEIDRVVDASGWLLGDLGSGYWLGHEAAKVAAADLDGRGEATALTPALLEALDVPASDDRLLGRPLRLRQFIDAIYALRPIELARFAPLVIAEAGDPIAAKLIAQAETYLIADFATVFDLAVPGPIALGGSVIPHLTGVKAGIAKLVNAAGQVPDIQIVTDGSVGAVVLAMRATGIGVDAAMFRTIAASIAARRAGPAASA
jgi:N-acetylglucosamine kinase-like BadF-type ATPase